MPTFTAVDEEQLQDLMCVVCLYPWTDPVELQPCRHIFCRGCANLTRCHMCRGAVASTTAPNRILVNMAKDARMKCSDCGWIGGNAERPRHTCGASGPGTAPRTPSPARVVPAPSANPPVVGLHQANSNNRVAAASATVAAASQQPRLSPDGPWTKYGLDQEEYDHIFCVLLNFDTDDSGLLDKGELSTLCRFLNFANAAADIDRMFREMNTGGRGVTLDNFCQWLSQHRPDPQALYGMTPVEYHNALFQFHEYDRDNSGQLDINEFRQLAIRMGYARHPAEADNLFRTVDANGSGSIDLHELLTYVAQHNRARHQQPQQQSATTRSPTNGSFGSAQATPQQWQQQQQLQQQHQQLMMQQQQMAMAHHQQLLQQQQQAQYQAPQAHQQYHHPQQPQQQQQQVQQGYPAPPQGFVGSVPPQQQARPANSNNNNAGPSGPRVEFHGAPPPAPRRSGGCAQQ